MDMQSQRSQSGAASLFGFGGLVLAVIGGYVGLPLWLAASGAILVSFTAWLIFFVVTQRHSSSGPSDSDGSNFGDIPPSN